MKKTFNVVCVTKFSSGNPYDEPILWHRDIQGEARVDTTSGTCVFQGQEYPISHFGEGLDSNALVIGVRVSNPRYDLVVGRDGEVEMKKYSEEFDVWDLYTDAPVKGSGKTPEEIREIAAITINRRRNG